MLKCKYCGEEFSPLIKGAEFQLQMHEMHNCKKRPMPPKPVETKRYKAVVSFVVEIPVHLTMANFQGANLEEKDNEVRYVVDTDVFKTKWKIEKLSNEKFAAEDAINEYEKLTGNKVRRELVAELKEFDGKDYVEVATYEKCLDEIFRLTETVSNLQSDDD